MHDNAHPHGEMVPKNFLDIEKNMYLIPQNMHGMLWKGAFDSGRILLETHSGLGVPFWRTGRTFHKTWLERHTMHGEWPEV